MVTQLQKEAAEMAAKQQPPVAKAARVKEGKAEGGDGKSPKRSRTETAFGPASELQGGSRAGGGGEEDNVTTDGEDEPEDTEEEDAAMEDAEVVAAEKQFAAAAPGGPLQH